MEDIYSQRTVIGDNLVLHPDTLISAAVSRPTGGGAREPRALLNDHAHRLDGRPLDLFERRYTFDTYDGQNQAHGPDWYAVTFPSPVWANCVEMTMGLSLIHI